MDIAKLSRINLSLLATLQVLLQERNARAAAKKLNLSQSAISKNLSQLRLLFDDPLFHRAPNGLAPTPLARSLEGGLCDAIFQIDALINPQEFIPDTYRGRLRLAMHDAGFAFIGAPLMAICHQSAPGLELDLWYKDSKGIKELANGEIDLLILSHDVGHQWLDDENLFWHEIYRDPLACLVRPDNLILENSWDKEAYLSATHIGVRGSQIGGSLLDRSLHQEHQARTFKAMAPDFHVATQLISESDAVFTCSSSWADMAVSQYGLVKIALPFQGYEYAYHMIWHKWTNTSGRHKWLREKILNICNEKGLGVIED